MMTKMGFNEQWVDLIMKCVTTVTYHIKVNGDYTEWIIPQWGLHQGDPLSPYLFILCAEGLSALLQWVEVEGEIQGIKVCWGAPRINYLFFANDSLVLTRAQAEDVRELKQLVDIYEKVSGQMINREKPSILFSPNTQTSAWEQMGGVLSISQEPRNDRYLGLPVSVGKSMKRAFEYHYYRMSIRWRLLFLSSVRHKKIHDTALSGYPSPIRPDTSNHKPVLGTNDVCGKSDNGGWH
jgi:hypothetical protein